MSGLGPESLVVVTGAAGSAGIAVAQAISATGARVVGAGRDLARLEAVARSLGDAAPLFTPAVVDLTDVDAVRAWAQEVGASHPSGAPRVDGLVHLVGGYRGGARFTDTTAADAEFLIEQLVRTLQNVTLAFHDLLIASSASRVVIVSATASQAPTAGNAAYASAKAAAETWTLSLADSFRREQQDGPRTAAATVLVVKALVDDAARAAEPDRTFPGFTDVHDLAARVVDLWSSDVDAINGARIDLTL